MFLQPSVSRNNNSVWTLALVIRAAFLHLACSSGFSPGLDVPSPHGPSHDQVRGWNIEDGGSRQAFQVHLKGAASVNVLSWLLEACNLHASFPVACLVSTTFQFLLMQLCPPCTCYVPVMLPHADGAALALMLVFS